MAYIYTLLAKFYFNWYWLCSTINLVFTHLFPLGSEFEHFQRLLFDENSIKNECKNSDNNNKIINCSQVCINKQHCSMRFTYTYSKGHQKAKKPSRVMPLGSSLLANRGAGRVLILVCF